MAASMQQVRRMLRQFRKNSFKRHISLCTRLLSATEPGSNGEKMTHFGYQTVPEHEKEEKVHEVFKNVADKYDLMNDAMSGGVHRLWKDHFIHQLSPLPGTKLIDVAGGTGDIALRFIKYVESHAAQSEKGRYNISVPRDVMGQVYGDSGDTSSSNSDSSDNEAELGDEKPLCHVTVCDINQSMLEVGKSRAIEAGIQPGTCMSWLKGNAECLPVEDNTFDAYTIAYGIRNCTHIDKVVEEAYRVLKPGGRFMCLEFSEVTNPLIKRVYDEYSFQVIPVMGQILARDWHSYQYLVESIRQFPNQEDFKHLIQAAGFAAVTYENLMFGVTAIHSGFKI